MQQIVCSTSRQAGYFANTRRAILNVAAQSFNTEILHSRCKWKSKRGEVSSWRVEAITALNLVFPCDTSSCYWVRKKRERGEKSLRGRAGKTSQYIWNAIIKRSVKLSPAWHSSHLQMWDTFISVCPQLTVEEDKEWAVLCCAVKRERKSHHHSPPHLLRR